MKFNKVIYLIGVIFYAIIPLIIIVQNHLTHDDGGYRLGIVSILVIVLVFYLTIYKKWKNKINVWEIQDTKKEIVISFKCISSIIVVLGLWYVMKLISTNIDELVFTLLSVSISMIIGYVLQLTSVILD